MKPLIREIEERYGAASNVLLPVVVSPHQVEMLRAAEPESEQGWNFMLLLFAGSGLVVEVENAASHLYRLPEFRLPSDILDLEDFVDEFYAKVAASYGLKISLSRYLLMAHCTFMATGQAGGAGDDVGTSSRGLHIFTARATQTDEMNRAAAQSNVKTVKPTVLLDALQAEWSDIKTQVSSGGTLGNLRSEYDKSWAFVRVRVVAMAFQRLFGWPLPDL